MGAGETLCTKELERRVSKLETTQAVITQAQLDTKQVVDSHEERCPLKGFPSTVDGKFDKVDTKFTVILTSGITIAIFTATVILGLYDSKVSKEDFNTHITKSEEAKIRIDERFQTMFGLLAETQRDVSKGFNNLRLDMRDISNQIKQHEILDKD